MTNRSSSAPNAATASQALLELTQRILAPLVERFDGMLEQQEGKDPFQRNPELIASMMPILKLMSLYQGCEIRGFENLPRDEPLLFVGNHSGGVGTLDPLPLIVKWIEARGCEAPIYGLTYDLLFAHPATGSLLRQLGCMPASHHNARRALEKNASVIVFPGGDYEVFRPWKQRNEIQFGGRVGFIELALATGVRVVPMTIHGAHESTFVMTRGHQFARSTGLDRLRVKVFPIVWNLPLGPMPAFIPSISLPSRITVELGQPLDWSHHASAGNATDGVHRGQNCATDPEVLQECYDEITGVMQSAMDRMSRQNPYPILRRLNDLRPSRQIKKGLRFLRS
jgi:1-acyl-sn-glycerol-3-phosphate acyltransferase